MVESKKPKGIYSDWLTVTPELAEEILAIRNPYNRPIRDGAAEKISREMLSGEYRSDNGEALIFDQNGDLLDGQHRLWAVILSKMTFKFWATFNVKTEVLPTIGGHVTRSAADVMAMMGKDYAKDTALVLKLIHKHKSGLIYTSGGRAEASNSQVAALDAEHPGVSNSIKYIRGLKPPRFIPAVFLMFLHYIAPESLKERTRDFINRLCTGENLAQGSSILKLRNMLVANHGSVRKLTKIHVTAVTIKTWNAYKNGHAVGNVRFSAKQESYPELDIGEGITLSASLGKRARR